MTLHYNVQSIVTLNQKSNRNILQKTYKEAIMLYNCCSFIHNYTQLYIKYIVK